MWSLGAYFVPYLRSEETDGEAFLLLAQQSCTVACLDSRTPIALVLAGFRGDMQVALSWCLVLGRRLRSLVAIGERRVALMLAVGVWSDLQS